MEVLAPWEALVRNIKIKIMIDNLKKTKGKKTHIFGISEKVCVWFEA